MLTSQLLDDDNRHQALPSIDTALSIRPCRWYDNAYSLKTALELVRLTPHHSQHQVFTQLQGALNQLLNTPTETVPNTSMTTNRQTKRWYDISQQATDCMRVIALCPLPIQHRLGNLLTKLAQQSQAHPNLLPS